MNPTSTTSTTPTSRAEAIAQTLAMRRGWRRDPRESSPAAKAKHGGQESVQKQKRPLPRS